MGILMFSKYRHELLLPHTFIICSPAIVRVYVYRKTMRFIYTTSRMYTKSKNHKKQLYYFEHREDRVIFTSVRSSHFNEERLSTKSK